MQNNKTFFLNAIIMTGLSLCVSGCAVYNLNFACGDARGANCLSMDRVDRMIASGEIERFNESLKECKGKRCSKYEGVKSPSLADTKEHMVVHDTDDSADNKLRTNTRSR